MKILFSHYIKLITLYSPYTLGDTYLSLNFRSSSRAFGPHLTTLFEIWVPGAPSHRAPPRSIPLLRASWCLLKASWCLSNDSKCPKTRKESFRWHHRRLLQVPKRLWDPQRWLGELPGSLQTPRRDLQESKISLIFHTKRNHVVPKFQRQMRTSFEGLKPTKH